MLHEKSCALLYSVAAYLLGRRLLGLKACKTKGAWEGLRPAAGDFTNCRKLGNSFSDLHRFDAQAQRRAREPWTAREQKNGKLENRLLGEAESRRASEQGASEQDTIEQERREPYSRP